ncbi:RodZ domain-containing protein [Aestuariibacter sp. A3R04]|uniref:RodZ domain-containing protein n=1 Tax=Aestuariibacter sp. A3R04 TaxID=2841571 RepID=UPI001C0822AA|nr:RodZ domain-containing protein [Aestuariibacter sp. A3R04]MBU3021811.1 DUF4115 domain-containing protein [Aestuariibacter sp. A3R04]
MSSQESQAEEAMGDNTTTPGAMLRQAREKLGLSQAQMADKLFLKQRNIDDIEADRLDENMSVTFAKGYVRMYAKQVGVDDKLVISEFEKLHTTTKPPAKLQSFSRKVAKQAHDDRWMMVTWIILLLIVAASVVWWYQQPDDNSAIGTDNNPPVAAGSASQAARNEIDSEPADTGAAPVSSPSVSEELQDADPQASMLALAGESDSESLDAGVADIGISDASNSVLSESVGAAGALAEQGERQVDDIGGALTQHRDVGEEAQAAAVNDAAKTVSLVFTFAEDCWVNIEDATGEAIAYGVKNTGRVMPISGQPPFKVTLGAPDGVSITYEGEAVDISAFQDGRIARFSLPMQD